MMLNDIIAIRNSSDKLSGTGRLQALKDGSIAGLSLFTDDPEAQQKFFLSVLSQLGTGTTTAEESKNANLKIAEGRLTDDVRADNAVAGKPKVKQGKDGGVIKRLPSVYPEALGLVMGLRSLPELPQSDLSEDTVFNTLSAENEQEIASGLPVGKLLPEMMAKTQGVPGERNSKAGKLSMAPVLEDSNQDSVAQVQTVPKIEVAEKPDVKKASAPDLSGRGRVQAVPVKGLTKDPGQQSKSTLTPELVPRGVDLSKIELARTVTVEAGLNRAVEVKGPRMFQGKQQPDAATAPEPDLSGRGRVQAVPVKGLTKDPGQQSKSTLTPELIPRGVDLSKIELAGTVTAEAGLNRAVEVKGPKISQGLRQPDAATEPETDLSGRDRVQVVPVEGTPKLYRRQRKSLLIPDTVNLKPLAGKINPGVKGDQTQKLSSDRSMDAAVRQKMPTDQMNDPDSRPQAVNVKSATFYPANDAVETGAITATSAGTLNADDNETANTLMAASHTGKIAGGEEGDYFQPTEPESGELAVNLAGESQMEKSLWVNPSAKESRPDGQSFHTEVLKHVIDKTSTSLKTGQSEIRIDLKPESLGHLRLHVLTDHQQVTVKILAENPLVKEMIENQASLIKNELQHQGIHVNTVKVEMLMSGGSDFAYSQHEGNAYRGPRYEPAYGRGKDNTGDNASKEKDPLDQANNRGGSLVNYFA